MTSAIFLSSRALAAALHELPIRLAETTSERALARVQTELQTAISRITIGHEAADDIGLPRTPIVPLVRALSLVRFGSETLRRHLPGATELAVRRGRAIQEQQIADLIGDERVHYEPYAQRRRNGLRLRTAMGL